MEHGQNTDVEELSSSPADLNGLTKQRDYLASQSSAAPCLFPVSSVAQLHRSGLFGPLPCFFRGWKTCSGGVRGPDFVFAFAPLRATS
jgi:hypothetical protein